MTITQTARPISLSMLLTDSEKEAFNRFAHEKAIKKNQWIQRLVIEALKNEGYLPKEEVKE